jgi:hypothetical protein
MNIWLQIGSAVVVVLMLVFLYPTAKRWMTDGPKAQPGDWQAAMIPLLLVAGFVLLLIMLVRG